MPAPGKAPEGRDGRRGPESAALAARGDQGRGPVGRGDRPVTDVAAWLRSLGLGQYEAASCDNAVDDADVLRQLTEADLEKLGVRLGDRKRILKAASPRSIRGPKE